MTSDRPGVSAIQTVLVGRDASTSDKRQAFLMTTLFYKLFVAFPSFQAAPPLASGPDGPVRDF